jgi:hypothetical protein
MVWVPLKFLTIPGDRRSSSRSPRSLGPLRHAVTSGADWEATRRIDSRPASVCAPTVSAGAAHLLFEITDDTLAIGVLKLVSLDVGVPCVSVTDAAYPSVTAASSVPW